MGQMYKKNYLQEAIDFEKGGTSVGDGSAYRRVGFFCGGFVSDARKVFDFQSYYDAN